MSFLTRYKFHTYRYKGEILYSSIILASLMIMIGVAFPKDNAAIASYVNLLSDAGLDALFSTVDVNAPGWLFWVSLMGAAYTYFVSAIAGIRIGSKLFPTKDSSALELISSSPMHSRRFYLENIVSAGFAIILIFLPSFLILSVYSIMQDALDTIPRLAVMFLLNSVVVLFFIALSSLPSAFRFSQGSGSKLGYFYLIYAFLIEFTAGSLPEYADYAKISVNSYVNPSAGLLNGEHHWQEAGIIVIIVIFLLILSLYFIGKPDYIEKVGRKRRFSLSFLPSFSSEGRLAKKYPLLFDQFRKDRSYFFIWMLIVNIVLIYINAIFTLAIKNDPNILITMTTSFGGILDAFSYGYEAPPTYVGFLTFEVFGLLWLYFGLFVLIPAINIPNRDQANNEQDFLWSNSVTQKQVILNRTLSLAVFFTIYFWISYFALLGSAFAFDLELDALLLFTVFAVGFIYYFGLMLLFLGMTMFFRLGTGKKITLWFYIISVFILIVSFLMDSLDSIKYFSVVYYYDPVGLLLEKVDVFSQFLYAIALLLVSAGIFIISLHTKYQYRDMLM